MYSKYSRDAGGGGAGGHVPPQVLGYQLTLFGPRGADYARHSTKCPPSFRMMRHLLIIVDYYILQFDKFLSYKDKRRKAFLTMATLLMLLLENDELLNWRTTN
jgi:hypothetical protein